jgi:DNA-binding MarR family transcriptional regulator
MQNSTYLFENHSFYNLSRYLFLKIERNYSSLVEKTGITLPQLRVLWIIKSFPEISSSNIAKMGYWTKPTVTKIIRILEDKKLILRQPTSNKKLKKYSLTVMGLNYIELNRKKNGDEFPLFKLMQAVKNEELDFAIDILKYIMVQSDNTFIFEYIEKVNELSLKIDYCSFESLEKRILKKLVCLYNLLRVLVVSIENNHSTLLKNMDLTYPQLRALKIVSAFQGITSAQLSEMALWAPSTANLIIRNMYNKDLIYKKRGAVKNSLHIFTMEKGDNLIKEDLMKNTNKIEMLKIIGTIPVEKIQCLNKLFSTLNRALDNYMVEKYIVKTFEAVKNVN